MVCGGISWLLADKPQQERRLSALFDLFHDNDVVYRLAVLMDEKKVTAP
jgi:hypothetical protein